MPFILNSLIIIEFVTLLNFNFDYYRIDQVITIITITITITTTKNNEMMI